jgi:DNA-binding MltR family transcriptional regulator
MAKNSTDTLKKYAREEPTTDEHDKVVAEVQGDSDRAMVVLMGSMVDGSLEYLIRDHMRDDDAPFLDSIFYGDGLLGSFSAKIRTAYALGLITADIREDLDTIREIRNACAHAKRPISFDLPQLKNVVERLNVVKAIRQDAAKQGKIVPLESREMFKRALLHTETVVRSGWKISGERSS